MLLPGEFVILTRSDVESLLGTLIDLAAKHGASPWYEVERAATGQGCLKLLKSLRDFDGEPLSMTDVRKELEIKADYD